jgi:hypothetical protein
MAKALYGHMASPDHRLMAEIARLRLRVSDLETQVERLELERSLDLTRLERDLLEPVTH